MKTKTKMKVVPSICVSANCVFYMNSHTLFDK